MLKSLFAVFAGILLSQSALADSLHPCTPTVRLQASYISCLENDHYYSIQIDTLVSRDIPQCQGEKRVVYKTAEVKISDMEGTPVGRADLFHGNFTYELGTAGDGSFKSEAFGLDLKSCVSPMHGGVSAGN